MQFGPGPDEVDNPTLVRLKIDSQGAGNYIKICNVNNTDNISLDPDELAMLAQVGLLLCKSKNDVLEPNIKTDEFVVSIAHLLKTEKRGEE